MKDIEKSLAREFYLLLESLDPDKLSIHKLMQEVEVKTIEFFNQKYPTNIAHMAKHLKVGRTTMHMKLQHWGIRKLRL